MGNKSDNQKRNCKKKYKIAISFSFMGHESSPERDE
jgi:hypothetical protein